MVSNKPMTTATGTKKAPAGAKTGSAGTVSRQQAEGKVSATRLSSRKKAEAKVVATKKASAAVGTPAPPRTRSTRRAAPSWGVAERVAFVTSLVGVRGLATMLNVAPSQPSRWSTGEEVPSAALARQVVDIDHVLALLVQLYEPETAAAWLRAPNARLDGTTPIEVLRQRGSTEVVSAIRADLAGVYD